MVVNFENHTIKIAAVSPGFWQSEILDSQQRLVGCTCDRTPDSTLNRAKEFVETLILQPGTPQRQALQA